MSGPFQHECPKCEVETKHLNTHLWGGRYICTVCSTHYPWPKPWREAPELVPLDPAARKARHDLIMQRERDRLEAL